MNRPSVRESAANQPAMGTNQSGVRANNERLLLSLLRWRGPMAKAEIARATGLSAQTASNIMRDLETEGLIVKGEPQRGKVGQPSVPIGLDPEGAYFWGLKIGRRSIEIVLTDFLGKIVGQAYQTYLYPTPEMTLDFTRKSIDRLSARLSERQRSRIAGLGIAMPFLIWRWAREINVAPEKMEAWKTFDVAAAISEFCDVPVFLENDASAACGAELAFGEGEWPLDFLYIYIGYFIGGGVVLGGSLFTGPTGNAGAIAPIPVMGPDGRMTQLLDMASLFTLERALIAEGGEPEALWRSAASWEVPRQLLDQWVATASDGLAQAIMTALSIIDFEAIVIDGWMPSAIRLELVEATKARIAKARMTGLNTPMLREGTIGANARALGGASLPLQQRFLVESRRLTDLRGVAPAA